ncbi:hypothetical protein EIN_344390 [Entamoeba invadens IP1]|uniref:Uncharacterized protein n=1 Tax=Entamoeba invadens IP1 TaxID=370355 RepID=A0A0A1U397_ENTIV|nr:hypothetical protein EIN_344390 [Entamoeba invadens IP1]ELP88499.1 hypothetical protein EIN_344390 [Entamoeba invadens IP1]|eukprot:XP_004255270.1 hypothetical protein EIN_344390 [Entamoeba invadens IP1]
MGNKPLTPRVHYPSQTSSSESEHCDGNCHLSKEEIYFEQDKAWKYLERYKELIERVNKFESKFFDKKYDDIVPEIKAIDDEAVELHKVFIHAHVLNRAFNTFDYEKSQKNLQDIHRACSSQENNTGSCDYSQNHFPLEVLRWKKLDEKMALLQNAYLNNLDTFTTLYANTQNQSDLTQPYTTLKLSLIDLLKAKYPSSRDMLQQQQYYLDYFKLQFPLYYQTIQL